LTRVCTICSHAAREEIDSALVRRTPYRDIALRYSVSKDALSRHLNDHLADYVQQALSEYGMHKGVKVLDKLTATLGRLDSFLDEAEGNHDAREFVMVAAELRRELDLLAKLQGALAQEGAVNIYLSAEWITLRTAIIGALEPYPQVREDVLAAIAGVSGNGNGGGQW
jgi:DNA-binding transcriptional ArsR family regulator